MNIPRKPEEEEVGEEIDFAIIDITVARTLARDAAVDRLVRTKVSVYHAELGSSITFTKKGIKECINQPFNDYREKLSLIYSGLEEALRNSIYSGSELPDPSKPHIEHIASYHYFESTIAGKAAFFNVQLTKQGDYVLYTITDNRRSKKSAQRA